MGLLWIIGESLMFLLQVLWKVFLLRNIEWPLLFQMLSADMMILLDCETWENELKFKEEEKARNK